MLVTVMYTNMFNYLQSHKTKACIQTELLEGIVYSVYITHHIQMDLILSVFGLDPCKCLLDPDQRCSISHAAASMVHLHLYSLQLVCDLSQLPGKVGHPTTTLRVVLLHFSKLILSLTKVLDQVFQLLV